MELAFITLLTIYVIRHSIKLDETRKQIESILVQLSEPIYEKGDSVITINDPNVYEVMYSLPEIENEYGIIKVSYKYRVKIDSIERTFREDDIMGVMKCDN